jgi:molybdenum cofactor synthesis domain-containing protein
VVTAGIVVIGNEVLSGKVEEANARYMIRELRALGVELKRVVVIRDELPEIAREVGAMAASFDHVITSGGVGSTHDDVTMEGIAQGLGLPLERNSFLIERIQRHFGPRASASVLRMADLPAGAELVGQGTLLHPIVRARNVWVLPGVPEFLRAKFEHMKPYLQSDPIHLRQIYSQQGEDELGDILRDALEVVGGIEIGSYPRFDTAEYKVKVTVEGRDAAQVARGITYVLGRLDAARVVRVE